MAIVQEKGINDMPYGWYSENNWNKKVYLKWSNMLMRVYNEKYQKTHTTYVNATICLEWHWLSNFVRDFVNIEGYDEHLFLNSELQLDKDIKSNGKNNEYSLKNCKLVKAKENSIQANKTRDYSSISGKNSNLYGVHKRGKDNPNSLKVIQYDNNENIIKIWDSIKEASLELKIKDSNISLCCKGKRKSAGGFKWVYYKEEK